MNLDAKALLVLRRYGQIFFKKGDALKEGNARGKDALELLMGGLIEVGVGITFEARQSVTKKL
jgi:hypothetical protein